MTREEYRHRAKVEGTRDEVQAENYSFSHTFLAPLGQLAVGEGSLYRSQTNKTSLNMQVGNSPFKKLVELLNHQSLATRKILSLKHSEGLV